MLTWWGISSGYREHMVPVGIHMARSWEGAWDTTNITQDFSDTECKPWLSKWPWINYLLEEHGIEGSTAGEMWDSIWRAETFLSYDEAR